MTNHRLQLDVVTPAKLMTSTEVDEVVAPGPLGEFCVLPGHTPFLAQLGVGEVRYKRGQTVERLAVADGYAEIGPDRVTILAESCERADEIDVDRAEAAKERAHQRLMGDTTEVDFARAEAALRRARSRLQVASGG